jgi:hypothetical protein
MERHVFSSVSVVLIISSACVFAGRAWIHLIFDIPIRSVVWHQQLMEGLVNSILNISWEDFVRSRTWDQRIQFLIQSAGVFYSVCFVYSLIKLRRRAIGNTLLLVGAAGLLLLSIIYFIDKFWRVGELLEFTVQWMSPVLLVMSSQLKPRYERIFNLARFAVALTFLGHGLYAIGYYPVPGNFIDMMIMTFGISQSTATTLLAVAGWIDIVVAVALFFPYVLKSAAMYAFAWGLATAFARLWANFDSGLAEDIFLQWAPEVMVRVPNALIPMVVFIMAGKGKRERMVNP